MRAPPLLALAAALALAATAASAGCGTTTRTITPSGATGSTSSGGTGASPSTSSTASSSAGGAGGAAASTSGSGGAGGGASTSTSGAGGGACTTADCSDPGCLADGWACAPPVPTGWQGPGLLYSGAGMPPGCGGDWTMQAVTGGLGISAQPAICAACACTPASNQVCENQITVSFSQAPGCMNGIPQNAPFGLCEHSQLSNPESVVAGPVTAMGGSCAPSGGMANLPPAAFDPQGAVCAMPKTTGIGCGTGTTCVPKPPAGYGSPLCIFQSGDVLCPAPDYIKKTLLYQKIADTRGCSACACGAASGGTCPAELLLYGQGGGCGPQTGQVPADGTCQPVGGLLLNLSYRVQQIGAPTGGTCPTSGGQPTGMAAGSMPVTVCCN